MKSIIAALVVSSLLVGCASTKNLSSSDPNAPIASIIDLTKVKEDKIPVTINPGKITKDTISYFLPRVIQGTYAVSDFGKFVEGFKAFDYKGNELSVDKQGNNVWVIANAKELDKVSYYVNDTYDIERSEGGTPFSPSGTNISSENYVLNLHGFIGYFDLLKGSKYSLDIVAPASITKTAALPVTTSKVSEDGSTVTDTYFANRYFDITDNPMMYGNLDVEEFQVGDIKIVLSVYSPNGKHTAAGIKETVFKMMKAQKAYLGDINSTKRYDILLYLASSAETAPTGFGALEHHTSTVVVLPEIMSESDLATSMIDVVSHEFFHIVTPLSVHSEDVHYFDYDKPTFSKHLWMYEGVTEYFASLFQINQGLVSEEEFYTKMMGKIKTSQQLDDKMSFTVMSENILEEPYASNYFNVYQKGALIGMCIDILMREASNGQRGILSLMKELSKKYGQDKPFEDDKLIEEISAMTYPSVANFLNTHVVGTTPIDYSTFFNKVGLGFTPGKVETNYVQNAGVLIIGANPEEGKIFFNDGVANNSFWADNGVKPNDVINEINGTKMTLQNANEILSSTFQWQPGDSLTAKLMRDGEEVIINASIAKSYTTSDLLSAIETPSKEQLALREIWLKK